MSNHSQGPPAVKKQGKVSWTKRFICFFLPKKWHKYVTPEAVVMYNIGSNITWVQAAVLLHWEKVSLWATTHVVPKLLVAWKFLKDVASDAAQYWAH